MQSIRPGGNPGTAFVGANGTIVEKKLAAGEEIIIDQTSLVGFTNDVTIDVRRSKYFFFDFDFVLHAITTTQD